MRKIPAAHTTPVPPTLPTVEQLRGRADPRLCRLDGQRLFMANGKLVTMKEVRSQLEKKPIVLKPQDCPEKIGAIVLSRAIGVRTTWSPTRTRRMKLQQSIEMGTEAEGTAPRKSPLGSRRMDIWPMCTHDEEADDLSVSARYREFIENGQSTKSGINVASAEEKTGQVFNMFYMPSSGKVKATKKHQEAVYFETQHVNRIEPKPLRQFGKQDRPHHMSKNKTIPYAFS